MNGKTLLVVGSMLLFFLLVMLIGLGEIQIYKMEDHELICEQLLSYQEDTELAHELVKYDCHVDHKH